MNTMLEFLLVIALAASAALEEPTTLLESACPSGSGINLTNTRIISIGPGFVNSPAVTCLDLKDNMIETVADGAFNSLPNLKQLYISNNKINSLTELLSSSMAQLEVLDLTKNKQSSSSATQYITGHLPALRTFSLSENFLGTIIADGALPKLEKLDISQNKFKDTPSFSALVPDTLKHLNLSRNQLATFAGKNWSNLTTLDLSYNNINGLSYEYLGRANATLAGLNNLRELISPGCLIRDIAEDTFTDTVNLEILDLAHNYLSSLAPDLFFPLRSLKVLGLKNNPLGEVPRFQELSPLTSLDLESTKLTVLRPNTFWWGVNLKVLNLKFNYLTTVDATSFSGLTKLELLDLSFNALSTLPPGWCADLTSLRYLDLKANIFTSLESVAISDNIPLHYLYFEDNRFSLLKPSSLNSMPSNVTIILKYGRSVVPVPDVRIG